MGRIGNLQVSSNRSDHISSVSFAYARALLELADSQGQLGEIGEEVQELGQLLDSQPRLGALLSSRLVSLQEKTGSIEAIFKGRLSDLLYRFIQVVNAKGRLDILRELVRAYGLLLDERNGVVEGDIFVAQRMDEDYARSVADRIGAAVGLNVVLKQHEEPELIGGMKIRVGDKLIDGSVATQLRLMRESLIKSGREQARTQADHWMDGSTG